ncbi:MAG: cytochrome c biogenesis protein CcsA [Myxococcales bacterium]|nr:cytochrome c biogenesis protein CcsA [Myxococcales bacterium]
MAALCLYAISSAWYVDALLRGGTHSDVYAKRTLQLALTVHGLHVAAGLVVGMSLRLDLRLALSATSLLLGAAYLLTAWRRPRLALLGAFIIPVVLLLASASELAKGQIDRYSAQGDTLLTFHIAVNVLGLVAFILAFAVSAAYLIQETMLRKKNLHALFQRLPDLHVLDNLVLLFVTLGFPLLSLGIATGAMRSYNIHGTVVVFGNGQIFALLAWACFAGVLVLRFAAGWRGRRAAIGTMVGFVCSMLVIFGYLLRGIGLGP